MHTPGPWTYSVEETGEGLEIKAGEVYVVAGCGCCGSPWMENVDDAKLITAAPELLESLKEVLKEAVGWLDDSTGHLPDEYEWYQKAIAVINKASRGNHEYT